MGYIRDLFISPKPYSIHLRGTKGRWGLGFVGFRVCLCREGKENGSYYIGHAGVLPR